MVITQLKSTEKLDLYRAETDRIWAQKGVSPFGSKNVFGNVPGLLLNRK